MNSAECRTANWQAIGYEDGAEGQNLDAFGDRRKACAKHGVAPNFEAYLAGRDDGLTIFCRPQNGYRLGARGRRYTGVCPAGLEAAFVGAHTEGYGLYRLSTALKGIDRRLRRNKQRAKRIEFLLAEKTTLLIGPEGAASERAALAIELKQLAVERGEVEEAIRQLEHDHAVAEHEYEDYRLRVGYRYGD